MEFSFTFTIRDDSGKVMTYEEFRAEKKERIRTIMERLEDLQSEVQDLIAEEDEFRDKLPGGSATEDLMDDSEEIGRNLEDAFNLMDESLDALREIH